MLKMAMLALGLLTLAAAAPSNDTASFAVANTSSAGGPAARVGEEERRDGEAGGSGVARGASNLTAVMLGESQRRHLQMSAALEDLFPSGCEMNKFQQDIEYLD